MENYIKWKNCKEEFGWLSNLSVPVSCCFHSVLKIIERICKSLLSFAFQICFPSQCHSIHAQMWCNLILITFLWEPRSSTWYYRYTGFIVFLGSFTEHTFSAFIIPVSWSSELYRHRIVREMGELYYICISTVHRFQHSFVNYVFL